MFKRNRQPQPLQPTVTGDYSAVTVSAELVPFIEELEEVVGDLRALHDRLLREEQQAQQRTSP